MRMEELENELDMMMNALKVKVKKTILGRHVAVQYTSDDFGVAVFGIERMDYSMVESNMTVKFQGWRRVYITTEDNLLEKKDEVIWELMRSGYMKWVRLNFPRDFTNLITMQNFGNKIINQRLKIWAGQSKYKFFIEDNESAKKYPANYVMASDPSYFDYMP